MCLNPIYLKNRFIDRKNMIDSEFFWENFKNDKELIPLPCGKCVECMRDRSLQWSYRMALECLRHREFCFITLTYAETDGLLNKRDYQLFLKSLRKAISPTKISFFCAGEYGSKKSRPHFHFTIFGWIPKDLKILYEKDGIKYYTSDFLSNIWKKGFICVQRVDFNCLKYLTKYLQKGSKNDDKAVKPFVQMSLRPAIGKYAINKDMLKDDKIYLYGNYIKLPRYFLDQLKKEYPIEVAELKEKRKYKALLFDKKQKDYILANDKVYQKLYKKRVDN